CHADLRFGPGCPVARAAWWHSARCTEPEPHVRRVKVEERSRVACPVHRRVLLAPAPDHPRRARPVPHSAG
ncbi:MAG: hypothetical protein AVDCRST_MAG20-655, partial [uncultured Acidimicrobiales bacterium]